MPVQLMIGSSSTSRDFGKKLHYKIKGDYFGGGGLVSTVSQPKQRPDLRTHIQAVRTSQMSSRS